MRAATAPRDPGKSAASDPLESLDLNTQFGIARLAAIGATVALAGSCTPGAKPYMAVDRKPLAAARISEAELSRLASQMNPADLASVAPQTAEQINALRPFADEPIRPMRAFVFKGEAQDRAQALNCLSQAVYYEAAREPLSGQQAVAQVVLNRMRHPAYPKSICGVVYQGAGLATGCQFTFTCDGSLRWRPEPALWARAQAVAQRALGGYVARDVGSATHYHAAYVAPYWAPTLVKMTKVGQHIFYRWTGPWGEPRAFTGRYAGREAELSRAVLRGEDPRGEFAAPAPREVTLDVAGEVRTYKVADAAAPGGERTRVQGVIQPIRRRASPEEIKRINASLAGLEKQLDAEKPAEGAQVAANPKSAYPGESPDPS